MKEFLRRFLFFLLACICCSPLIWAFFIGIKHNIDIIIGDLESTKGRIVDFKNESGETSSWSVIDVEYITGVGQVDTITTIHSSAITEKDSFVKTYVHKEDKKYILTKNKLVNDNWLLLLYSVGIVFLIYLLFGCIKSFWNLVKSLLKK